MATLILKALLALYLLQALLKFCVHFLVPYATRRKRIDAYYTEGSRSIAVFDDVVLGLMVLFVVLLFVSGGMEYLNFTTGFVTGLTVLQVYFHRFRDPVPLDKAPAPPVTPIKHMSYAIQANPRKAWREYLLMAVVFAWALFMLVTGGFRA